MSTAPTQTSTPPASMVHVAATTALHNRTRIAPRVARLVLVWSVVLAGCTVGGPPSGEPSSEVPTSAVKPTAMRSSATPVPKDATSATSTSPTARPRSALEPVPTSHPSTLPPVDVSATVWPRPDVAVAVRRLDSVDVDAHGPGEIAGPAARVDLAFTNSGKTDADLTPVRVSMLLGAGAAPAPPVESATSEIRGLLRAGEETTGSYAFSIPANYEGRVAVVVTYVPDAPQLLFEGVL